MRLVILFAFLFGTACPLGAQQWQPAAKVGGAVYAAAREEGWGYGGAARLQRGPWRASAGVYFLDVINQHCTLGVPGGCTPESPPARIFDLSLSAVARPLPVIEIAAGIATLVRDYRHHDVLNAGLDIGASLLLSRTGAPALEIRRLQIIGERSGTLSTLAFTFAF
jgi:hypothetical protein